MPEEQSVTIVFIGVLIGKILLFKTPKSLFLSNHVCRNSWSILALYAYLLDKENYEVKKHTIHPWPLIFQPTTEHWNRERKEASIKHCRGTYLLLVLAILKFPGQMFQSPAILGMKNTLKWAVGLYLVLHCVLQLHSIWFLCWAHFFLLTFNILLA